MVGKTSLPGRKSNEHAHDKQETAEGKEPQREEQRVESSGGGGSPATQTNRSDKLEADEEESAQAQSGHRPNTSGESGTPLGAHSGNDTSASSSPAPEPHV